MRAPQVRETSIEAYNKIKANGLLRQVQLETYSIFFESGPLTTNEMLQIAAKKRGSSSYRGLASLQKAVRRLCHLGVLKELEKRVCLVTGNNALEFDVTNKLPVEPLKKKKEKCPHCDGTGIAQYDGDQRKLF